MRALRVRRRAQNDQVARLLGTFGLTIRTSQQSKNTITQSDLLRLPVMPVTPLQGTDGKFLWMLGYDDLSTAPF